MAPLRSPSTHPQLILQTGDFCALKLLNSSAGQFDPPFGRNTFEYYLLLSGAPRRPPPAAAEGPSRCVLPLLHTAPRFCTSARRYMC